MLCKDSADRLTGLQAMQASASLDSTLQQQASLALQRTWLMQSHLTPRQVSMT